MHWNLIVITSLLIITCGVIKSTHLKNTRHVELNVNVTKSWLTAAEFANALSLSLNVSRCTNVYINGEFMISLL